MKIYDELVNADIISKIKPLLETGEITITPDWKIHKSDSFRADYSPRSFQSPWMFLWEPDGPEWHCWKKHLIYFDYLDLLPSDCLNCYKVVLAPPNLETMHYLYNKFLPLEWPAKIGAEVRPYVNRLWGMYFYNRGLEAGRTRYQEVKDIISGLDRDINCILKRGCTEFEIKYGPSNQWDNIITEKQREYERKLDKIFVNPPPSKNTAPPYFTSHKWRYFVEFAAANGDETYLKFTDGEEIPEHTVMDYKKIIWTHRTNKPPVTYHSKQE